MIFSHTPREDITPKRSRESDFAFMDRSARPEICRVRDFVEACASEYPETELNELIARIRSGNDTHFRSATFELILHACLLRLGFELQPHPELHNGSTSRPDFLVSTRDGDEFYLEAVLASENNGANESAEARKAVAIDMLAATSHPNFMIAIRSNGDPLTPPSGRQLTRATLEWLDSLDPDEVQRIADTHGLEATPSLSWSHEDWSVTLRPIPIKPQRRGKSTTLIGLHSGGGGFVDAWTPIRNAVKHKGSKYGDLGKPLLVAVNFDSFNLDPIDEMQALYGQEQFIFDAGQPDMEPRFERAPNGAWHGKNGPRGRRVSGLWCFNDLNPYTVAVRRQTIYFNPWALYGLSDALRCFPHAVANGSNMEWSNGLSLRELLDLPASWPE